MKDLTPEEKKESQDRLNLFVKEYQQLTETHNADMVSYPQFVPGANGTFQVQIVTQIVDKKHLPIPSPLQNSKGVIQES